MVSNEAPMPPIWDAEMEVHFFQSLQGHKPCGINKHFHMTCIQVGTGNDVLGSGLSRVPLPHDMYTG